MHSHTNIDWAIHFSLVDICSSLFTTFKYKSNFIPERNWIREFFWNRRFVRELPNITYSGIQIFHLFDSERLAWDAEEQTSILEITKLKKLGITQVSEGNIIFLHLRFFDFKT